MLAKVFSAAIVVLDAQIIEVEVGCSYGLRHFEIVGLPDNLLKEANCPAYHIEKFNTEESYLRSWEASLEQSGASSCSADLKGLSLMKAPFYAVSELSTLNTRLERRSRTVLD